MKISELDPNGNGLIDLQELCIHNRYKSCCVDCSEYAIFNVMPGIYFPRLANLKFPNRKLLLTRKRK